MYTKYMAAMGVSAGASPHATAQKDPEPRALPEIRARLSSAEYTGSSPAKLPLFLKTTPEWSERLTLDRPGKSAVFEICLQNDGDGAVLLLPGCVLGGRRTSRLYLAEGTRIDSGVPLSLPPGRELRIYAFAFFIDRKGYYLNTAIVYPVKNGKMCEPALILPADIYVV